MLETEPAMGHDRRLRGSGTDLLLFRDEMPKKPLKIEIVQEGGERFLLKTYADGREDRTPIVKLPKKPPRYRYRTVTLDKSRKAF